jgi:hypothetical protein
MVKKKRRSKLLLLLGSLLRIKRQTQRKTFKGAN